MTVSAATRKSLPPSKVGKPSKQKSKGGEGSYPMPDKKHAGIAKAFAAMHHDPNKAAIDAKANKILGKGKK